MNAIFDPSTVTIEQAALGNPVEAAEVDAWVMANPQSTPFHRPAWSLAVEKGTGQRAVYLVARDIAGAIVGVLPMTFIQSRLFGRALVSAGFAVDGGILAQTPKAVAALTDACWLRAQDLGCTTAELRGGMLPAERAWTIKADAYLNFARPLAADDAAQLLAVPKRHRAEIRKGLERAFTFESGDDARLRTIHYDLYARSVHRLGTPVFPRALFEATLDAFGESADISLILLDGIPQSAVISLYHRESVMPYWHGAAIDSRTTRSNEVLYYWLMNRSRARGLSVFDFGRSKVGTGPAAWKKSWGFEGVPLNYAVRATDGQDARDVNPLSPQYRRKVELWKKLPLPLANLVGPWLAKGLG